MTNPINPNLSSTPLPERSDTATPQASPISTLALSKIPAATPAPAATPLPSRTITTQQAEPLSIEEQTRLYWIAHKSEDVRATAPEIYDVLIQCPQSLRDLEKCLTTLKDPCAIKILNEIIRVVSETHKLTPNFSAGKLAKFIDHMICRFYFNMIIDEPETSFEEAIQQDPEKAAALLKNPQLDFINDFETLDETLRRGGFELVFLNFIYAEIRNQGLTEEKNISYFIKQLREKGLNHLDFETHKDVDFNEADDFKIQFLTYLIENPPKNQKELNYLIESLKRQIGVDLERPQLLPFLNLWIDDLLKKSSESEPTLEKPFGMIVKSVAEELMTDDFQLAQNIQNCILESHRDLDFLFTYLKNKSPSRFTEPFFQKLSLSLNLMNAAGTQSFFRPEKKQFVKEKLLERLETDPEDEEETREFAAYFAVQRGGVSPYRYDYEILGNSKAELNLRMSNWLETSQKYNALRKSQ